MRGSDVAWLKIPMRMSLEERCIALTAVRLAPQIASFRSRPWHLPSLFRRWCADKGAVSLQGYEQLSYLPFDPANKRTEAVAKHAGACWRIAKGSPKPSSPCALGQLGASTSFLLLLALIL